ncbi:MAG: hypothetical protein ACI8WA_001037, partial [Polaribacter sp.]
MLEATLRSFVFSFIISSDSRQIGILFFYFIKKRDIIFK